MLFYNLITIMLFYNLNTIMLFDNLKQYNAKYMYMLKLIHCEFTMKKYKKKLKKMGKTPEES